MKIHDTTVCVTGGSNGLGKSLVNILLPISKKIIVIDRNKEPYSHPKIEYISMDVVKSKPPFISVDIFISNIGMSDGNIKYEDKSWDNIKTLMDTNITQHLWFLKHAKYKKFVIIGSVIGYMGVQGYSMYCASKAFLRIFCQGLRAEGHNILLVCPYKIKTKMFKEVRDFLSSDSMAVARRVITAIECDESEVIYPWYFNIICRFYGILPRFIGDFVSRILYRLFVAEKKD